MMQNTHLELVTEFYDTHPISERQVLDKLVQDGFDLSSLDQGILQDYDQDALVKRGQIETVLY